MLPSDRFIFSIPLSQILLKPDTVLQLFIDQNQPIVTDSIKCYQMLIQRQHQDIRTYFLPQEPHTMDTRVASSKETKTEFNNNILQRECFRLPRRTLVYDQGTSDAAQT